MPTLTLTDRGVKAARAKGRRSEYRDDVVTGLVLRVTDQGVKTYSVWYRVDGQPRRLTLGRAKTTAEGKGWLLADARQRAREVLAEAGRGVDAVAQRKAARAEAQKRDLTGADVEALARRFLADAKETLRPRSLQEYTRALERDVFPAIGKVPPEAVTRGEVRALVESVARRAPVQANRTFAAVRRVFSWAVERDLLAASPCAGLKAPAPERARERVLTNDELRRVALAARTTHAADFIALLLHTATRSEETRAARWGDIDLERKLWTIPGNASKNREAHAVPLSRGALKILKARHEGNRGSEWVFPAKEDEGFIPNPSWAVVQIRTASGVSDLRLHDLRRTVATRLAESGVPVYVIEAVLGHRPPRLVRTYQRHTYVPEQRTALEAWSAKLARVLTGKTKRAEVVPIARRA